jgi:hypothetical protein
MLVWVMGTIIEPIEYPRRIRGAHVSRPCVSATIEVTLRAANHQPAIPSALPQVRMM